MEFGVLEDYKVGPISNVYYLNEFITKEKETKLLNDIDSENEKWIKLHHRKLQNCGGIPHPDGSLRQEMPIYLQEICNFIEKCNLDYRLSNLNQILLNEYTNGCGIPLHKDGELFDSCVAVLSLNSSATIEFYKERHNSFLWWNPPVSFVGDL
jgi:alkylated DNA repair protein alkB family protein 6